MTHSQDRMFRFLIRIARGGVVLLMISVAVAIDAVSTERFEAEVRQEWQTRIDDLSLKLQSTILQNIQTVWGLAANVSVEPDIGEARFEELAAVIFRLAPELRNIGLAPGFIIRYMYPLEGNEAAIGLDLESQSLSSEQTRMLLDSERAVFSGPINLVQGGQGLAARIPIFENVSGEFWGVISVILDLTSLYDSVNLTSMASDAVLSLSTTTDLGNSGGVFFGATDVTWNKPVHSSLEMPGVSWTLLAQPRDGWPGHPEAPWMTRSILAFLVLLAIGATFWLTQLLLRDRQMQQRFWGLFELAPVGIGLYNANNRKLIRANRSLEYIMGNAPNSLGYFDKAFDEHGKDLAGGFGILDKLANKFQFSGQQGYLRTATGTLKPIVLHGLRLDTPGENPVIWLIAEDISEQKKADRIKNEFISTVSHELRTPLTSISGALGLILGGATGQLPDKTRQMLAIAHRNTDQLRALIDDLLDIEKLASGNMSITMEHHSLNEAVTTAIEDIRAYADQKRVQIRQLETSPGLYAYFDQKRLKQALTNLLSNAIKFSSEHKEVMVKIQRRESQVVIEVADQGPGVPESFRGRIFEKFAQADSSSARSKEGTGLGLAVTRELMCVMGGEVGFESKEGEGACFWLALPVADKNEL
ncbi:sensor histidine kinase [Marinobacter halophilus]|uniref:histidine kinase n=1 Tax=Marinobacter halophilus TaxID=1323740 RepID=A0A2T1KFJ2_9GAMM|nr:ATP-binding protein [Marinobacter halophilus]PSF08901.1 histidine kinase [Marinobacter halophilus]GGC64911.1 hypothetical protein GCM10011362_11530 [Marinobacter halophilus]